jgi:hypothetical protein
MPVDGIIFYLTRKHRENVHNKGIVAIKASSVALDGPLRTLADLTTTLSFQSLPGRGEWVCWDFHEMRVRPTHYTIRTFLLKSWVVEGSLDSVNWTEIDRQMSNNDFQRGWGIASFAVSNSAECRFIRLTQTGEYHLGWIISAFLPQSSSELSANDESKLRNHYFVIFVHYSHDFASISGNLDARDRTDQHLRPP